MKLFIDAMGGDNAPLCVLQGAVQAKQEFGAGVELVLLGKESLLRQTAEQNGLSLEGLSVVDCPDTVEMEDDPVKAVRHKPDSSLVKGLTMLKNGEGDAFVSAGSTGALHVGTSLLVKTLRGVKRPALATCMPGSRQKYLLLDCGANVECRPEMLNAFGTMGSIYMRQVMGRKDPAVALINNGTEETKGTPVYREAHALLKANPAIRFVGNIEPREVPTGAADVVVCDGFVGNVVLKLTEGVAKSLLGMLKEVFLASPLTKLSYLGVKGGLGGIKKAMDSEEVGGAPLLGAAKPVIKAHGSSKAKGIKNAIRQAKLCVENDLCGTMQTALNTAALAAQPLTGGEGTTEAATGLAGKKAATPPQEPTKAEAL